ncbi:hypothetical protein [Actinophytocola sp.]|uniref:hypothetical protein n=1 Tax=Actinophytocola sp. TaxID=1872138 RepID=UPI002ED0F75C
MSDDRRHVMGAEMAAGSRVPDITAHVGGHIDDPRERALLGICARAVADTVGLHHLAYYTDRVLDFALDVFDDADHAPPDTHTEARPGLRRLGRQLCGEFERLNERLLRAHTGTLIRTVLRTDDAEIVCDLVVRAQFVVAVTYTGLHDYIDESNSVDRTLAGLVRNLRDHVGLPSQNPGGYETESEADPAEDTRSIEPHVDRRRSRLPREIEDACLSALSAPALHLVAYCVDDETVFLADVFEHPALSMYFPGPVTPEYRRRYYRELCKQLAGIRTRLARVSAHMLNGRLKRVVLDVEQGAVYYFRVTSRVYLVGVTLHQPRVRHMDLRMAQLAAECGKFHPTE